MVRRVNTIIIVAEGQHKFVAGFGVLSETETTLLGSGGPAEVWEGRGDYVECWSRGGIG